MDIVTGNMHVLMYLCGPGRFTHLFKVCLFYVGACYCGWNSNLVICWDYMEQASESCVTIMHLCFDLNDIFLQGIVYYVYCHCGYYWDLSQKLVINPYPTAFPYGNGMVVHFYQQQESSTTKTVHKVINKGLKTCV